ncbi:MAG: cytochrome c oxidase assembly protein [Alphaproteobacteria bacterium]|nr:cytochrome c oxidase assembly protein [Alphaproteobacteria bacterium]OJV13904.1 MAG: hypothetical protein BGO27_08425 [Alphaproteobacteria bacterium 33-17]
MNPKNRNLAINVIIAAIGMLMLAYGSVPLYRIFCQKTGFAGTVQIANVSSKQIGSKKYKVFFDANVEQHLTLKFQNVTRYVEGLSGANLIAYYKAENLSDKPLKIMATYNVTPLRAGRYFQKIECFCFEEQILNPKQAVEFPVLFYIDPKIEKDSNMDDIEEITLSYTFFDISDR